MVRSFRLQSCMAAVVAAMFVYPQFTLARVSLSERVTALENQLAQQDSNEAAELRQTLSDLLFRINDLQQEVRELRGMVENQAYEIDRLRTSQREQFLDLDNRLNDVATTSAARNLGYADGNRPRLGPINNNGGFDNTPSDGTVDTGTSTGPSTDSLPATDSQPLVQRPEVREPVDAGLTTSTLDSDSIDAPTVRVDPETEKRAYEIAFEALKQGRYAESARLFSSFLRQFPDGEYADNAQYWLGESYYVTQNHKIALDAFKVLISRFPQSSKLPDAKLKLGFTYYELKQWQDAESLLRDVIDNYPGTTVARLAQNRLNAMRIEGHIQ